MNTIKLKLFVTI